MAQAITKCRSCGASEISDFLDLGLQALTGVFPESMTAPETYEPLVLTKCEHCHLVQLKHSASLNEMYGDNYGYRSGLNNSMIKHLGDSVDQIRKCVDLKPHDLVIDIGSNDGTLLSFYPKELGLSLVGVDPVGKKFKQYYRNDIHLVDDFFPSALLFSKIEKTKAQIITSFSCFYDLENPNDFAKNIESVLAPEGVWVFEQSYLPTMVDRLSYDTVCHEHLEYYTLETVQSILTRNNLKIIDVQFNDVNGGSFRVTAAKLSCKLQSNKILIDEIIRNEIKIGLRDIAYYKTFAKKVAEHRDELKSLLKTLKSQNKRVVGLGASTKGNVVLQYCHLNADMVEAVAEVNPYKFGRYTPGSKIPILSEEDVNKSNPDFKLVLPWHFRNTFIERENKYLSSGGKLIFPLPKIEIYSGKE